MSKGNRKHATAKKGRKTALGNVGRNPKSHEVHRTLKYRQCTCGHFVVLHDFDNELTRGECLNPYCECTKFVADVRARTTATG